jgi:UDP-N-acetylglucosamine diphosphorylase / glucose-1-phosphate thymidylyltransferase / UDP-N-acetylgalactosamine diphosphorylase / glucosamine-1-phosphate N-acetyltransferase / galactosamine-1-phosphate N-acetyltransferase
LKIDTIILFETEKADSLYPFSILHTAWEVRCGAFRIFERIKKIFPDQRIIYTGRDKHLKSFLARFDHDEQDIKRDNILILHSAILTDTEFFNHLNEEYSKFKKENGNDKSVVFTINNTPVAAYVPECDRVNPDESDKKLFPKFLSDFAEGLHPLEITYKPKVINYLWDVFDLIENLIMDDFKYFENNCDFEKLKSSAVYTVEQNNIKIGKNNNIAPGVVLDASNGPIITGTNVKIMANAVIEGPCFIGNNSIIKIGAKIYGKTSIGEFCKVGGEVENSVIHAYSNKQHDGFLGHSYIGEWVNIGADTNTSDLKNTYSEIKVRLRDYDINTGRIFVGLLCGDHTKTAINTTFNTGTVAGICGILVADGFLPNKIPSFAWRGTKGCSLYKIEKAMEVAKTVMKRRNKELLDEEIELIKDEYRLATIKEIKIL